MDRKETIYNTRKELLTRLLVSVNLEKRKLLDEYKASQNEDVVYMVSMLHFDSRLQELQRAENRLKEFANYYSIKLDIEEKEVERKE